MNNILKLMPCMYSEVELKSRLLMLPDYSDEIQNKSAETRIIGLSDIYDIYIPSQMTYEIYCRLYLALLNSFKKKQTHIAMKQRYENAKIVRGSNGSGILGGTDSFTVIGISGLGKSAAICKAVELLEGNCVVELESPYTKIIPCLTVQCPFDSSVKGLLFEILRKVDETLNSRYYENAVRARATTDMLIGSVSQVALNHIGVLIVDEIQNVAENKNGRTLVGMLTQLINNSGISICMVGTPKCRAFFEQEIQLARRAIGLEYREVEYGADFYGFCRTVFGYQFTKYKEDFTDGTARWLYEHSGGIISVVISLIHDAQELAILNGTERLNIQALNSAYAKRMGMMHSYIDTAVRKKYSKRKEIAVDSKAVSTAETAVLASLSEKAKTEDNDFVTLLKERFSVSEVKL